MSNNGLPAIIDRMAGEFAKALPDTLPAERFVRCVKSTLNANPELQNLERTSLLASIMKAAQDGLVVDGKEAAIVPFKGKATYIPMVAGLVKKIRQHSKFANLSYGIIYQKEVDTGRFEYVKGDNEYLKHDPIIFGDRGEAIGAYAIVTTDDGTKFRAVLRKDQIAKRLAKGMQGGAKVEWQDEFWLKTAIKAVYKIAPNSGDEAEYLDGVFKADEEPDEDGVIHPPMQEPVKATTRASAAVKAAAPIPQPEIVDAEIVPDEYHEARYDDDEMPM